ncbi:PREDICTED: NAC transcription factor NAM-1-like [Erythranthe guttata]|uniref:NAC transcription factor NAM-1-like n=1 Tax=Erythranthe guttata TaxID=4155 RepID=UPI00064DEFE3|nr:PREDICTED: NAC transcription factor NAM-1-like [Erythranthe guttata]|eukprot:XP_012853254.1 PREDICTED: NAC transcription factor NAM-1-like [Erythranthe guttata]
MEFPPGIRFKPKDEELIVFYLKPKVDEQPVPPSEINIVDFYQYDPQTLADEHPSRLGQKEWYFFTFREKKYQNGKRPNRSAGNGYWKATAADKPIHLDQTEQIIGYKKNLVYYEGDHKYSRKTDWIMHEYKLPIADPTPKTEKLPEDENDMRLDSWVICRIHKRETKSNKAELDDNNTHVALPPPPQEMDEQRHHQHQQQHHHHHHQYNPFPLVDDFFPEDDVYYGQDGFFQPRQQDEGFQPQQQQDECFQPQQQQDGFFQPRQQDEGFQPQQQQEGFFQPRQQDEGFQPQQQQDEGFQPQQQQDGFFQPRQQDKGFQPQQQQDGFFQPRQQDEGFQPQQQSDGFFGFFQPQQDEEYSEYVASLLYYRSLSS